jgi:hypothetical protein
MVLPAMRCAARAFGKFFARLAADGINQSNTLFVITADENDHFAGVQVGGCDGVTTPCTYAPGQIGELNTNATGLLATQKGNTTPFAMHSDAAPNFYLTGNPARDAAVTRGFERDLSGLTAANPYSGNANETISNFLADPVEMKVLHMVTADPARTPTVTAFAKPDYFVFGGAANCSQPCVAVNPAFAWNHGDVSPDINRTWLGLVGPGVPHRGLDAATWADHTDIRPTMLALLGLRDDYQHDGRVLIEELSPAAVPASLNAHRAVLLELSKVFKQLDASVGSFGLDTLTASTTALKSGSASDDTTYQRLEAAIQALGTARDQLASKIGAQLDAAAFGGQPIDVPQALAQIAAGKALLAAAHRLAGTS